ncbi:MAG: TerC family protein [Thiobacillus sp.]|nr:TerC family protein [Thiobacillus sp.]
MEFLMDPSIWIGLLTLVVLEIVLGIDNLVFIAILADKLPPHQRDRARLIGLSLALLMRLGLLAAMSWLVTLTEPLFSIAQLSFSGRDLILLAGGLFLVFKATMELHERLEGSLCQDSPKSAYASFWMVVAQIIVLDAVFSLDAVITAVGMVEQLGVMMAAVVIAMGVMIIASKPLTRFVNAHPTIVILCLSFLLMIGFSLVAEGFGFHIPKEYLYAAIGFSILIETFNQVSWRNLAKNESRLPMRERTADAILGLMGGRRMASAAEKSADIEEGIPPAAFGEEERFMISGVLTLADRSIRTIMTPRGDISWVDCDSNEAEIRAQLLDTPHSIFPVCRGSLDHVVGVVRAKELFTALDSGQDLAACAALYPPIVVPDRIDVIKILGVLRKAKGSLVLVVDEYGTVQGLVTPLDILEAIAGEFPDADETPDIIREGDEWRVKGTADLHQLEQSLGDASLVSLDDEYVTLAGLLLAQHERMPIVGESFQFGDFRFDVLEISSRRVELVRISRALSEPEQE